MSKTNDKPKTIRCVVYTRKSTDENLDLDFNSLDAQREAGEAYIKSQQHEGWVCLNDRYDDAGFSGGNIERPAFQRLMADVAERKVDCRRLPRCVMSCGQLGTTTLASLAMPGSYAPAMPSSIEQQYGLTVFPSSSAPRFT